MVSGHSNLRPDDEVKVTYVIEVDLMAVDWDELPFNSEMPAHIGQAMPKEMWYGSNDDGWGVSEIRVDDEGTVHRYAD